MAALVEIEEAEARLRIDLPENEADLQAMIEQASSIVIKHLKSQADPTWTAATVPANIKAAVLMAVARLDAHREAGEPILNQAIRDLLHGDRDPALA